MIGLKMAFFGFIAFMVISSIATVVNIKTGQDLNTGPIMLKRSLLVLAILSLVDVVLGLAVAVWLI